MDKKLNHSAEVGRGRVDSQVDGENKIAGTGDIAGTSARDDDSPLTAHSQTLTSAETAGAASHARAQALASEKMSGTGTGAAPSARVKRNRTERTGHIGNSTRLRKAVQVGWGLLSNGYVQGFFPSTGGAAIYQGPLKAFCVPGMNCYSCPGALGSCPIGSLQAVLDGTKRQPSFYVAGFLATVGLLVGRFICGWLCLFGLVQELLYKIPTPKLRVPERIDATLRYLKYAVLGLLVIGLPAFYRSGFGVGMPFFCKFLCPVGTLEAGVPLVLLQASLRQSLGMLFWWKVTLAVGCVVASIVIYRPFCKYVCPLGAFYALFQKASLFRMRIDTARCVSCGACARTCKMGVNPMASPNHAECIRCGECIQACPTSALSFGRVSAGMRDKAGGRTGEVSPVA